MAKRRKLDNIELDSIAAIKLGYGVHYGRYKVDHPLTKDSGTSGAVSDSKKTVRSCKQCGKQFDVSVSQRNKVYCCDMCRDAYNSTARIRRKRERAAT